MSSRTTETSLTSPATSIFAKVDDVDYKPDDFVCTSIDEYRTPTVGKKTYSSSVVDEAFDFSEFNDSTYSGSGGQGSDGAKQEGGIRATDGDGIASFLLQNVTAQFLKKTAELTVAKRKLDVESILKDAAEASMASFEHRYTKASEKSERYRKRATKLSKQFVTALEEERQSISRELHDVVAQSLTGVILRLTSCVPGNRSGRDVHKNNIAEVQRLIIHAVTVVQRFARDLRPSMLDDLGLTPALASFFDKFSENTGIKIQFTSIRLTDALNTEMRTAFFRVAQEACNNVSRHANATHIRVRIHRRDECLCMLIQDNGQAFSVAAVKQVQGRKCLGLLGMKERMRIIGGAIDITSSPRKGTAIVASVPLSKISRKTVSHKFMS